MAKMKSAMPARKVTAATLGAAVTGLIIWGLNKYAGAGIETEVASMFETVVVGVLAYLVPPSAKEQIVP